MTDTSKKIETIEYRPTWESLVSSFVMLIENGDAKGRAWAIEEITRMAKAADIAVASHTEIAPEPEEDEAD